MRILFHLAILISVLAVGAPVDAGDAAQCDLTVGANL
jgi:hypothetical protein